MKHREIKFRGYATGIGWVYGSLVNNLWTYSELSEYEKGSACCEIITGKYEGDCWEDIAQQDGEAIISVVPDSVGEFTGLKDKNGKEIYEGDILKYTFEWETYIPDSEESYDNISIKNREVLFADGAFRMKDESGTLSQARDNNIEIIGNSYENAGLLAAAPLNNGI